MIGPNNLDYFVIEGYCKFTIVKGDNDMAEKIYLPLPVLRISRITFEKLRLQFYIEYLSKKGHRLCSLEPLYTKIL